RKNIPALVAAWNEVRRSHPVDLVLAGRPRADFVPLAPEPGLHLPGEVSDQHLAELYSGALAVVYPSWYEGFGLPVLEAMQCGACVITSCDAALEEITADAAICAGSQAELTAALMELAGHPERAESWRARAFERAAA